jgi:hypothetical protein
MGRLAARFAALLLGLGIGAAAAWGALLPAIAAGVAAQRPNPDTPDGDPCCPVPDTWGEVGGYAAASAGGFLVVGLILAFAVNLIYWAARGRWLQPERLALIPTVGIALALAGIGVGLAVG